MLLLLMEKIVVLFRRCNDNSVVANLSSASWGASVLLLFLLLLSLVDIVVVNGFSSSLSSIPPFLGTRSRSTIDPSCPEAFRSSSRAGICGSIRKKEPPLVVATALHSSAATAASTNDEKSGGSVQDTTAAAAAATIPWTLNTQEYGEYNERRDWGFAYSSTRSTACGSYIIDDIEGKIPQDLVGSGTFYKIGPGNFERGGCQYEHVLDGDGFVTAFTFQDGGNVRYTGRFVETEYFQEERDQDKIKYRNVFGTQRPGGALANAFDLTLKNVANTNILEWGGRLFAFWEAGRPYELDPSTLETLLPDSQNGPIANLGCTDCKVRGVTIDKGGPIDQFIGAGRSFTAHPHVWDANTLVGFKTETDAQTNILNMEFLEYDADWKEKEATKYTLIDCPAPHDFSISENYYSFFENPFGDMDRTKYLMGFQSPTQMIRLALREPTKLHLVPRPLGNGSSRKSIQLELPTSYFNIHLTGISEEKDGKLSLYSTGWDLTDEQFFPQSQDTVPLLGAWGGAYPDFLGGFVPPSLLYQTVVDLETAKVVSHQEVCPGTLSISWCRLGQ